MTILPKLTVQVTKTADGLNEYIQIMSSDMYTVNIVLIANTIEIKDDREPPQKPKHKVKGKKKSKRKP